MKNVGREPELTEQLGSTIVDLKNSRGETKKLAGQLYEKDQQLKKYDDDIVSLRAELDRLKTAREKALKDATDFKKKLKVETERAQQLDSEKTTMETDYTDCMANLELEMEKTNNLTDGMFIMEENLALKEKQYSEIQSALGKCQDDLKKAAKMPDTKPAPQNATVDKAAADKAAADKAATDKAAADKAAADKAAADKAKTPEEPKQPESKPTPPTSTSIAATKTGEKPKPALESATEEVEEQNLEEENVAEKPEEKAEEMEAEVETESLDGVKEPEKK